MLILKYIDIGLIVIVSAYIGFYKSKKFFYRVKELKNFKSALNIFRSKIEFTYEPIRDIFYEISKVIYLGEDNIFKNFNTSFIFPLLILLFTIFKLSRWICRVVNASTSKIIPIPKHT